jgi:hypothetical protein
VLGLLLGLLMLGAASPRNPPHSFRASFPPAPAVATSPAPPVAATGNADLDSFLPQAEGFVSQHRGLQFKAPVQVTLLDDAAFQQRVVADVRKNAGDYTTEGRVLRALGLIGPGVDVEKAEESLLGAGVVGFYDPDSKALVVRGGRLDLAAEDVLIHELTHALQDQVFDIGGRTANPDDESEFAFTCLVEGDAVRIQREWEAGLSTADRRKLRDLEAAQGSGDLASVPQVLLEIEAFPYQNGPKFVQSLLASGGQAQLDSAFKERRPTTTAQILHPELYVAGTAAAPVSDPIADGARIDHGAVGELGLELLFAPLAVTGSVNIATARAAATSWAGDRYVAWSTGDAACVRDVLKARDPAGLAAMKQSLDRLASSRAGVSVVQAGDELTLTACA